MATRMYVGLITVAVCLLVSRLAEGISVPTLNPYGPNNCFLSLVDKFPCSTGNVMTPGQNNFTEYRTWMRYDNNYLVCRIRPNYRTYPIPVSGTINQVFTISSPGYFITPSVNYRNNRYVDYNIACGENRIAFVLLGSMDLEGKNCYDQTYGEFRCVDYLRGNSPHNAGQETCGNDVSVDFNPARQSSLHLLFRSSSTQRFSGFAANIICFDPAMSGSENCTMPPPAPEKEEGETLARRRRQSLRLPTRPTGSATPSLPSFVGDRETEPVRYEKLKLLAEDIVTYENNLIVLQKPKESTRLVFSDITTFYKVGPGGKKDAYNRVADEDFTGPGFLYIVDNSAYCQDLVITKEELEVLTELTQIGHIAFARELAKLHPHPYYDENEEESELEAEEPEGPGIEPAAYEDVAYPENNRRIERQVNPVSTPSFTDQAILLALTYENSCNPVLQASAMSIIEELEKSDPARLDALRASLAGTAPTSTASAAH